MRKIFLAIILMLFCIEVYGWQPNITIHNDGRAISEGSTAEVGNVTGEGGQGGYGGTVGDVTSEGSTSTSAGGQGGSSTAAGGAGGQGYGGQGGSSQAEGGAGGSDKDRQLYMWLGIGGLVVAGYIGYQMSVKNKLLAEQIKQSKS